MHTFATVLIIWFSFLILFVLLLWYRKDRDEHELPYRETVCINTLPPDSEAIRGVLTKQTDKFLTLTDSSLLMADNSWRPVPGVTIIPVARVAFIQHVAAEPELRVR